jgi:hypothetical protein
MRPEAAELRIGLESGQQIICHRRDRIIPTKAVVKGLRLMAHRVLLKFVRRLLACGAAYAERVRLRLPLSVNIGNASSSTHAAPVHQSQ